MLVGGELGERLGAFGLAGVDADLATGPECLEHLTDMLTEILTGRLTLGDVSVTILGEDSQPHRNPHRSAHHTPGELL